MFNFLKKKKQNSNNSLQKEFENGSSTFYLFTNLANEIIPNINVNELGNVLNDKQKASIINSLRIVAESDGKLDSMEKSLIASFENFLGLTGEESSAILGLDVESIPVFLNSMDKKHKHWTMLSLTEIAGINNVLNKDQTAVIAYLNDSINITSEEYVTLLQKSVEIKQRFEN